MLSIYDDLDARGGGPSRRELLRVGGLSGLGLTLPGLIGSAQAATQSVADQTYGKAKNVLVLFLQGGPPQHETFDPKPDAPAEIRGPFKPIQTSVPGISISELLPRTAQIAHKLAIVRSMCTHTDIHDVSSYWILTGYPYKGQNSRQISNSDWPYLGSILRMLKPSEELPGYTSVWLPDVMRLNDNVQPAGQTGGFLGKRWNPERILCDPGDPNFRIEGFSLPGDVPPLRLQRRERLLTQVDRHFSQIERAREFNTYDRQVEEAFGILSSGKARAAFDLSKEPDDLRDRYGRTKWGQCLLLGRRLIEAGCRLVHVNWPREAGDSAVDNPLWDTHAQNADRLQDVLCPQFDVSFRSLMDDMDSRGLLDETLVIAIGEFGRTPRINANGGRDHWGHVFSFALAGAGIQTAQVYGSSDHLGAYPKTGKLEPQDLTATILHLLGVGHEAMFRDLAGRPLRATEGTPIYPLLGTKPATDARQASTGDVASLPPYCPDFLLNMDFSQPGSLTAVGGRSRIKGWQAEPLASSSNGTLAASLDDRSKTSPKTPGRRQARLGFAATVKRPATIQSGSRVLLAQEVRNPRAGRYRFTVYGSAIADSLETYREIFQIHFRCRLSIFGFADLAKDPRRVREYASLDFEPPMYSPIDNRDFTRWDLLATLKSQDDGALQLSRGVGVAIIVERKTEGPLVVSSTAGERSAHLCVDRVEFGFDARPRNDDVMV